ncbi:hypothetical protein AALB16_08945 [Lachnospiraceae bacterium 62-35]
MTNKLDEKAVKEVLKKSIDNSNTQTVKKSQLLLTFFDSLRGR